MALYSYGAQVYFLGNVRPEAQAFASIRLWPKGTQPSLRNASE